MIETIPEMLKNKESFPKVDPNSYNIGAIPNVPFWLPTSVFTTNNFDRYKISSKLAPKT